MGLVIDTETAYFGEDLNVVQDICTIFFFDSDIEAFKWSSVNFHNF